MFLLQYYAVKDVFKITQFDLCNVLRYAFFSIKERLEDNDSSFEKV